MCKGGGPGPPGPPPPGSAPVNIYQILSKYSVFMDDIKFSVKWVLEV